MKFRYAKKEDLEEILVLYKESFGNNIYPSFRNPSALLNLFEYPNFSSEGAIIAEDKAKIIGFGWSIVKKDKPYGHLMGLFVHPDYRKQGIGSRILKLVEDYVKKYSKNEIKINPSIEQYFFLGIDINSPAYNFFRKRGFKEDKEFGYLPIWMEAKIKDWKTSKKVRKIVEDLKKEDIEIRLSRKNDGKKISQFVGRSFPGGWHQIILNNFKMENPDPVAIAITKDERVIGFTGPLYIDSANIGTLGAVGVDSEFRKKGIGTAVFNQACAYWKSKGVDTAHLWTGTNNPAVKIYKEAGFFIVATYMPMKKKFKVPSVISKRISTND